jgi:hypothetical protein
MTKQVGNAEKLVGNEKQVGKVKPHSRPVSTRWAEKYYKNSGSMEVNAVRR